jgi:hypothetical protein
VNATVQAVIDAELALLEQTVTTPEPPYGYGSDLSCDSDLREDMGEVDGMSLLALSQAILRRLDCPRGALPDDPNYGVSLRSYLNRGSTADELRALAGQVRAEIEKDDRVTSASVIVTPSSTGDSLSIDLAIAPVDARIGGFSLTLAVTPLEILLEEIRRAA